MSECSPFLEFLKKFRYCRNASSSELLIKYDFLPSRLCAVWYYRSSGSVSTMNALREIYPHLNRALAIFIPNIIEVLICFTEKKKKQHRFPFPPSLLNMAQEQNTSVWYRWLFKISIFSIQKEFFLKQMEINLFVLL